MAECGWILMRKFHPHLTHVILKVLFKWEAKIQVSFEVNLRKNIVM